MEDDESTAERLEAALERIAQRAGSRLAALQAAPPRTEADTAALADRLDGLIAHLRGALEA